MTVPELFGFDVIAEAAAQMQAEAIVSDTKQLASDSDEAHIPAFRCHTRRTFWEELEFRAQVDGGGAAKNV